MKSLRQFLLLILLSANASLYSHVSLDQEISKEKMIENLGILKNSFQTMYAPAEWKSLYCGWDLDQEIRKTALKIQEADSLSLKDYHKLLRTLFQSPIDYHVSIFFCSTESAMLPLRLTFAEDRAFIAWIDPDCRETAILNVGDEVISIAGKPPMEALKELLPSRKPTATDLELAAINVTRRAGYRGEDVPQGPISFLIRTKQSTHLFSLTLNWDYKEELIPSAVSLAKKKRLPKSFSEAMRLMKTRRPLAAPFATEKGHQNSKDNPIGSLEGFVPPLGKIVWTAPSSEYFNAYLFETPNRKRIGYLRIPTYLFDEDEEIMGQLEKILSFLERSSEALVVDQTNNPGGYDNVLYQILSCFALAPLKLPLERIKITQQDVMNAWDDIAAIEEWLLELNEHKNLVEDPELINQLNLYLTYLQFVISEWQEGKTFTDPVGLSGMEEVAPHPSIRYTKPLLILINSLDFSCADLFPAILQDNKRAVLFGTTTAGAGGAVQSHRYPNLLGIDSYTFTWTMAERDNKQPIENLGVQPDIPYQVSAEDLEYNYSSYIQSVIHAAEKLIKENKVKLPSRGPAPEAAF